jgi:NAD(P)H-hydrate epimerase
VIDAAFGTGFRGEWSAPAHRAGAVLAVDIPSGVSGLDGTAAGRLLVADRTVTFAALKPGLLLGAGPAAAGEIDVVDIGLEVSAARAHLVTDGDLAAWVPARPADSHKWRAAVWVVAGSPGMTGAAHLVAGAALRSGAGYVRLSVPGGSDTAGPLEAVRTPIGRDLVVAGDEVGRFGALVVGPGLGRAAGVDLAVARFAASVTRPLVIDGDGLAVLGRDASRVARGRAAVTVLTPHDGEFEMLTGRRPGVDRLAEARWLAADTGAVVLLKGPSTVVAAPDGRVLVAAAGDARLATAGTGDVLAGIIAAFLARGVAPLEAAAAAAHLHGCAAALGPEIGMVASDLLHLVPVALAGLGPREAR